MGDNVIFPKIEDVSNLINGARKLVDESNVLQILSSYVTNCSGQIHDYYIDLLIRCKKKTIDVLSSLPTPIEMALVNDQSKPKADQSQTDEDKQNSTPQPTLKTNYPVISITKNWTQTYFLAGSLNNSYFFPIDAFHLPQMSEEEQKESIDQMAYLQTNFLSTTIIPPGDQMSFCRSVSFHPSDLLCAVSKDNSVFLYDISNPPTEDTNQKIKLRKISSLVNYHQLCITGSAFSPDGTHFVTSSLDSTIKTLDLIRSETVYHVNIKNQATYLDSTLDGRLVGITTDSGNLLIFDDRQEGSTMNISAHKYWASTLCFTNNSQYVATAGSDKSIAFFDVRQPISTVFRLYKNRGTPVSICFDAFDHIWGATTAGELKAWYLNDAKNVFQINLGSQNENDDSQSNAIYKVLFVEPSNAILYSSGRSEMNLMTLNDDTFSFNDKNLFNYV